MRNIGQLRWNSSRDWSATVKLLGADGAGFGGNRDSERSPRTDATRSIRSLPKAVRIEHHRASVGFLFPVPCTGRCKSPLLRRDDRFLPPSRTKKSGQVLRTLHERCRLGGVPRGTLWISFFPHIAPGGVGNPEITPLRGYGTGRENPQHPYLQWTGWPGPDSND